VRALHTSRAQWRVHSAHKKGAGYGCWGCSSTRLPMAVFVYYSCWYLDAHAHVPTPDTSRYVAPCGCASFGCSALVASALPPTSPPLLLCGLRRIVLGGIVFAVLLHCAAARSPFGTLSRALLVAATSCLTCCSSRRQTWQGA
jgi:hypothetical protein